MDFRNITRLFADPEWDGPLEVDENYGKDRENNYPEYEEQVSAVAEPKADYIPKPIVDKDGCTVKIINKVVSVYDTNGKLLRTESITDYTKKNINDTYANLDDFIHHWNEAEKKAEITDLLRESGIDLQALKRDRNMDDVDDFDFICHIAYGKKPLTRRERAENVKKRDVFNKYGTEARKVLEALLDKYANGAPIIRRVMDYGEYLTAAKQKAPERMTCILCKSGMYRIAEKLAVKLGADAIVDGSSIGQVASQTLPNILATRYGVEMPILSPLIGLDKEEITEIAKEIGTFEISKIDDGGCSAVPRYPSTHADLDKVRQACEDMNQEIEIEKAFENIRKL